MDELTKAFLNIQPPEPSEPIEYRLHYNSAGDIMLCTMQQHPDTTDYIIVDKETYDNYFRYTVVNKKLKKIDRNPDYSVKLKKSDTGIRVVKNNASIILSDDETHTNIEYYEYTN
jgi:hypothetical protein